MGIHSTASCSGDDCSDMTASTTISSHEQQKLRTSLSALESKVMAVVAENTRLRSDLRRQAVQANKEIEALANRIDKLEDALAKQQQGTASGDAEHVEARLRSLEKIVVGGQAPRAKSRGRGLNLQGSLPELTYQSAAATSAVTAAARLRGSTHHSRGSMTKAREQRMAKSRAVSQALQEDESMCNDDSATEVSLSLSAANLMVSDADLGLQGSDTTNRVDEDFPLLSASMHGSTKLEKTEADSSDCSIKKCKKKSKDKRKDSDDSSKKKKKKKDPLSSKSEHVSVSGGTGSSSRRRSSRHSDHDNDDLLSCQSEHGGFSRRRSSTRQAIDDDTLSCASGQSVASRRRAARKSGCLSKSTSAMSSLLPPMTIATTNAATSTVTDFSSSEMDDKDVELCQPFTAQEWADAQAEDDKLQAYLKNPVGQNMYPKFYMSTTWIDDAYLYMFRKRMYVPESLRQQVMEHYWKTDTSDSWSAALCKDKIWPSIDADVTNFRCSSK